MQEKQLSVKLTDKAVDSIVENGFDPAFGARPLRRYIQRTVETRLAKTILSQDLSAGTELLVDVGEDGELKIAPVSLQETGENSPG